MNSKLILVLFSLLLAGFNVKEESERARFHTRAFRSFFKPIAKDQEKQINKHFSLNLKWDIDWGIIDRFDIGSGYTLNENKQRFIGLYFNPLKNFLTNNSYCLKNLKSLRLVKIKWGAKDDLIIERKGLNLILTQRFRRANLVGLYDEQQRDFNMRLKELLRCDEDI